LTQSGLTYVEIGVTDLGRSAELYEGLLGLRPADGRPAEDGVRWLAAGPALLKLVEVPDGDAGGYRSDDDLQRGMRHIGFKVGDTDLQAERLRAAGVRFTLEPLDATGDVRIAFFRDPDGTLLELIAGNVHYHRTRSPELAERERVAAEQRPRDAGPVFDHIALTVQDAARSVAFYGEAFGYEPIGELDLDEPEGFLITYLQAGPAVLELFSFAAPTTENPWTPDPRRLGFRCVGLAAGGAGVQGDGLVTDPDGVPLRVAT
jgi:catechol 2,3-dioxygenase-like lactoylglutathione lyase family enzyme